MSRPEKSVYQIKLPYSETTLVVQRLSSKSSFLRERRLISSIVILVFLLSLVDKFKSEIISYFYNSIWEVSPSESGRYWCWLRRIGDSGLLG